MPTIKGFSTRNKEKMKEAISFVIREVDKKKKKKKEIEEIETEE